MGRSFFVVLLVGMAVLVAATGAWSAQTKPITFEGRLVDKASPGRITAIGVAVSWPTAQDLKEKGRAVATGLALCTG